MREWSKKPPERATASISPPAPRPRRATAFSRSQDRRQTSSLSASMPADPINPVCDRYEVVEGDGDTEAGAELRRPVENGLPHFCEGLALQTARDSANRTK